MINSTDYIKATEEVFNLETGSILAYSRLRHTALARHVAMFLVRKHTNLSLHEVGILFKRDHSCVVNACKIVNSRLAELSGYISSIEKQVTPKTSVFRRLFK
jgi:chromosomal replication initiator protein